MSAVIKKTPGSNYNLSSNKKILPLIKKLANIWKNVLDRRIKYDDNSGGYYLSSGHNQHNLKKNIHIYNLNGESHYDFNCAGHIWNTNTKIISLATNCDIEAHVNAEEIIIKFRLLLHDCSDMMHDRSDWIWKTSRYGYVHPGRLRGGDGGLDGGGDDGGGGLDGGGGGEGKVKTKLILEPNPEHKENIKLLNEILVKWASLDKHYYKKKNKYILSKYKTHPNFNTNITIYPYKNTVIYEYMCENIYYNDSYESVKTLSKNLDADDIVAKFFELFTECSNVKRGLIRNPKKARKQSEVKLYLDVAEIENITISPKKNISEAKYLSNNDKSPSGKSPSGKSSIRKSPNKKSPNKKSPSGKSPNKKSPNKKSPKKIKHKIISNNTDTTSTSPPFIPKGLVINTL